MTNDAMTRRALLRSGMLGACGASAGLAMLTSDTTSTAEEKPSALTITNVETFGLLHKLERAIGVSTSLAPLRDCLLVKISTDSGLVGWGETSDVGGTRGIIEDHLKTLLLGKNPLEQQGL